MGDVGTGASLTLVTSGWTGEILSINGNNIGAREVVETSHLGTTVARTYMPGDLYDPGELEVELAWDPDEPPPYAAVAEVIRVTLPIPAGGAGGAKYEASGFLTQTGFAVPLEERMTASFTVKWSGEITQTDST